MHASLRLIQSRVKGTNVPRASRKANPAASDDDDPMVELFDVLGQRWTMRLLWELRAEPLTYRQLAERLPGMSTSLLTRRLRELRSAGLVDHEQGAGYQLTALGKDLLRHLRSLRKWAQQVAFAPGRW